MNSIKVIWKECKCFSFTVQSHSAALESKGRLFYQRKENYLEQKNIKCNAYFIRKKNYSYKVELYSSIVTVPFKINTILAFIARDRTGSFTNPTIKF